MAHEETLHKLNLAYVNMQAAITRENNRISEKARKEKAESRLVYEMEFAKLLVEARDNGIPRTELSTVIRTNDGKKFKHFIELGGGSMRRTKTAEELETERLRAQQDRRIKLLSTTGLAYGGVTKWRTSDGDLIGEFPTYQMETGEMLYVKDGLVYNVDLDEWPAVKKLGEDFADEIKELTNGE